MREGRAWSARAEGHDTHTGVHTNRSVWLALKRRQSSAKEAKQRFKALNNFPGREDSESVKTPNGVLT